MRPRGNAERQTEMKRADVPPQRRRRERGRRVRKENKRKSDHAPQEQEKIFWAERGRMRQMETDGRTELSVAFLLKWKWSTERRGATLSELAATATNDVRGQTGVQLNMQ